ncbi:hypothetical protein FEM48_Zijuj04G0151400 [Ziziphus jujuba var. spinosa]|uniref:Uncharacterized protein n=1 Tax=Ziziphus jujuba var. spinosa TaxID=714518 RepID=A0A978VKK5_ZIZJJ|nr:hypothetical protein FEM48_Zijuj04G0151400 [Ziziphus jujuba var. spinosa]
MAAFLVTVVASVIMLGGIVGGQDMETGQEGKGKIHMLFWAECTNYYDWQTVGLVHSFKKVQQPGSITRLLSCPVEEEYKGMNLAPTHHVPSINSPTGTHDWYLAWSWAAGIMHWLNQSKDATNVDWVVIVEANMILRGPIVPWQLGAHKGRPVVSNNHGLIVIHIEDLRVLAPIWLSKIEGKRKLDATSIEANSDNRYSLGASQVEIQLEINDNLLIHPGLVPREGVEPLVLHYALPFNVGSWSFSKSNHFEDDIAYNCGRLFPQPPSPAEVMSIETEPNKRHALLLSIECVNILNEGIIQKHEEMEACPKPIRSKYAISRRRISELSSETNFQTEKGVGRELLLEVKTVINPKIHTIFVADCSPFLDWQTLGLAYSFNQSGQPGYITRILSCTEEDLNSYIGLDLVSTYPTSRGTSHWHSSAIRKPAAILDWLQNGNVDADFIVILDPDMILRGPITPGMFKAELGRPVSTPSQYAGNHSSYINVDGACERMGSVIIIHKKDLERIAPEWLHKTEEILDNVHYNSLSNPTTTDQYDFGSLINYVGKLPEAGVSYRALYYGRKFSIGDWNFDKTEWRDANLVNECWEQFPEPPSRSALNQPTETKFLRRDQYSREIMTTLNKALHLHHIRRKCSTNYVPEVTIGTNGTSVSYLLYAPILIFFIIILVIKVFPKRSPISDKTSADLEKADTPANATYWRRQSPREALRLYSPRNVSREVATGYSLNY